VKRDESESEVRELVARVTRAVAARTGKSRAEVTSIVAAEVAAALGAVEAAPPRPWQPASPSASPSGPSAARTAPARAAEALARVEVCASCLDEARRRGGKRAVVTTTGRNARGIVAKIAQAIADAGGDIVEISQTLVADYFTMIIVVDTAALEVPFAEFKARLVRAVEALGAECLVMHDDVVSALQRV
jgi:ACT domain-containing protein